MDVFDKLYLLWFNTEGVDPETGEIIRAEEQQPGWIGSAGKEIIHPESVSNGGKK